MPLDLKLVDSFVTVAETLNFSLAAERANTVQSAISAHIKALESQLGRTLVARGRGQPVSLTPDGAAFLVQARRLLALADEVIHSLGPAGQDAPLRLGTTTTFALSTVPVGLAAHAASGARAPVLVRAARSHELIGILEDDEIDVAVLLDQGPHPLRRHTVETELSWVAAEGFSLAEGAALPLAFLDDARDLRRHAFAALDHDGGRPAHLTTHADPVGLRAVLAAGVAMTILPQPAIVPPIADVGARLGLPPLGHVTVSIYAAAGARETQISALTEALDAALRAGS